MSDEHKSQVGSSEQRADRRFAIELNATVKEVGYSDKSKKASILNINQSGLCINSVEKVDQSRDIEVVIELAEGEQVKLKTKVVWIKSNPEIKGYSTGVRIIDTESVASKKFRDFYNERLIFPPTN